MTKPAILDPATRDGAQYVLLKLGQYRFHVSGGSVHIEVWGYHEELTQIKIRKIRLDGYKVPDLKKARLEEWANQKSSFQTKFKLVIDSLVWAEKVLTQGGPRSLVEKILEQHFGARNVDPLESIKPKIKSVLDGLKQTTQTNPLPIVDGVTALGSQGEGLIQYTTDADVASNHRDRFNASEDTMLVSALRTVQATQVTAANSTRNTMQTNLRKRTQTNAALKGVDEEKRIAVYSFGLALDSYRSPYSSARLLLHELFHKFCGCGDYFYCNIWEYPYYSNMSNEVALDNADSYAWITVSLKARAVLTYKNVERATISSS